MTRYDKADSIESLDGMAEEFRETTITIVGLGGVGSHVTDALVRNGVDVRLVDRGRIVEEDMYRQTIFLEDDISRFKAKQGKKGLKAVDSDAGIKAFHEELSDMTNYLLDSDLVIDSTGDEESSNVIASYCHENDIPVIHCGLSGVVGRTILCEEEGESNDAISYIYDYDDEPGFVTTSILTAQSAYLKAMKHLTGEDVDKDSEINGLEFE